MAQLQHWTVTCTTCNQPADYHCNTCGDILCPQCREIHIRSRGTGHHSIVPYSERVEPGKLTGQCDDHPALSAFTPGKLDIQNLEAMIGSLSMGKEEYGKTKTEDLQVHQSSPLSAGAWDTAHKEELHGTTSRRTLGKMLPSARVISTVTIDKDFLPRLTCTGSGQAWLRTGVDRLQLIDRAGDVKKTINTGFTISGITVTPQGDLLISDYYNKSIKSVSKNGNIETLFKTKWKPYGVCCLHDGDVVVAFYEDSRVIQYSKNGKVVREIGRSLFTNPGNVDQNMINHHIYVCDRSDIYVYSEGKLLAFNMMSNKPEYEYTASGTTKFTPIDVCTDQSGHVFITDWSNDRIHILDKGGRFLQYMMTKEEGLQWPYSIDTDRDGYAWVAEYKYDEMNQVKILKYID